MREAAIHAAYVACIDRAKAAGINEQQFHNYYADWEIFPAVLAGEVCGAVFRQGPELHVAVLDHARKRWASPRLWREVIDGTLDKYGYAVTSVAANNDTGQRFVSRIGFKETGRNGPFVIYRLERTHGHHSGA